MVINWSYEKSKGNRVMLSTDEELISIIIPIHNNENYLEKCVNSVINQQYINLEIILVNDGSEDNCGTICDKYAGKDKRVKVIHKANGGPSSARNSGIDIATGEWIGFVDSDDWLKPDMYEKLYSSVRRENADLAICGFIRCDENGHAIRQLYPRDYSVLTKIDAFNKLVSSDRVIYVSPCNKLYKKKIFNELRFPEGRLHEDEFIAHYVLDMCSKIVTIPECLYMYFKRVDSIICKPYNPKRLDGCCAVLDRYEFFRTKGSDYSRLAANCLKLSYSLLLHAFKNLEFAENKTILTMYYRKILWLLIKSGDLRAVKLFIFRYEWLYKIANNAKESCKTIPKYFSLLSFVIKQSLATPPRIFIVATPVHGNLGDHAIVYAEQRYFEKQGKRDSVVEIDNITWSTFADRIVKRIRKPDIVIIDGGGNLGTLWPNEDDKISDIISRFKGNEIIVFPQTCFYDKSLSANARLERNKQVYANAENLTIMFRDRASFDFALANFPGINAVYTKDIVLTIDNAPNRELRDRKGILFCLRSDKERALPETVRSEITNFLKNNRIAFTETTTVIPKRVISRTRKRELFKKWDEFASSRLVVTDRLHGMIFAAITQTPCIALDNVSGKVGGTYEFIKDLPYIRFLKNTEEIIPCIQEVFAKAVFDRKNSEFRIQNSEL